MTEEQLHSACVLWMWNEYPQERRAWHHNKNNSINRIAGARNKALGVVEGVWDFEWCTPTGSMVWIEFKVGKYNLSPGQELFAELMRSRRGIMFVIRTFEEFKELITKLT